MAADSEFTAVTRRPGCLRGISTLTGFALAVETARAARSGGTATAGWKQALNALAMSYPDRFPTGVL
ncbi:hypothetical protein [Lapillicoccus sp.]|uniref:hypothetical protein n=1 Tax=Lapillicoccus sp. TaxID=1909287 RepID=UPI0025D8D9B7|nr:hypothetical protein [Lapillicoccus sp.]